MDEKKMNLFMTILKVGLVAIGVVSSLFLFNGADMNSTVEAQESFRDGAALSFTISYTGFLIITGVFLILLFFVIQLITNPKKTIMSILGLLVAGVLYVILYMAGTGDTNETLRLMEDVQVDQQTIKAVSAGLYLVLILIVGALAAAVLTPIIARFKNN